MNCQICFDTFPEMYKVTCGSTVDHMLCFGCEEGWREKMPVVNGKRMISCPTCRQVESSRTVESLERELAALYLSPPAPVQSDEPSELVQAIRTVLREGPVVRASFARSILSDVDIVLVSNTDDTDPVESTPAEPSPASPTARSRLMFCASGRDCRTRSRIHTRTKTRLKCRGCGQVACCKSCSFCSGCPV
jgi:hypothetical protein